MGYKAYSDSYLMSLTKTQIIELLRVAEHNFFATEEALNNSAKAGMEIAEKFDKAKELLKAAVEGYSFIGHITKDYACPSFTSCSACPMDEGKQCKIWEHEAEALTLIGEGGEQNE